MNRLLLFLLALLLGQCKSTTEVAFNYDRNARELQEKINDTNYTFYHEKHPPRIEMPVRLPLDFRSEKDLRSGSFIYRLRIDEAGKFTYRALKPAPEFFEKNLTQVLDALKFKPAWIGPKNFAAELDIDFILEFEAH